MSQRITTSVCLPGVCARPDAASTTRPLEDPRSAARTPVAHVMTNTVICVREDLDLDSLMALFVERGLNGVPVVGETGDPIGIVSRADVSTHGEVIGIVSSLDIMAWIAARGSLCMGTELAR